MKVPKAVAFLFGVFVLITLFLLRAAAQLPHSTTLPSQSSPVPEMERVVKALVGDWNTTETMERGEFFPNGGSRHGVVHVRPAAGGTTWIYEVHSDRSAGKTRWHARHLVGQSGKSLPCVCLLQQSWSSLQDARHGSVGR